ncbi:MAG TPA: ammonia channel protein, partial [Bacteroidales bacterium]|nr:ammonia channel protein [Bacteroidales bacterium]
LAWMFFDTLRGRKASAMGACIGAVVGLVAITPAAGYVSVGASLFIGTTAAVVSNIAVHWKNKTSVDDALDVFPTHGVGGIMGMILTGIFARDVGLVFGKPETFLYHLLAIVIVGVYVFSGSFLIYKVTNLFIPVRVSKQSETIGLDLSQHDEIYALNVQERELEEYAVNGTTENVNKAQ